MSIPIELSAGVCALKLTAKTAPCCKESTLFRLTVTEFSPKISLRLAVSPSSLTMILSILAVRETPSWVKILAVARKVAVPLFESTLVTSNKTLALSTKPSDSSISNASLTLPEIPNEPVNFTSSTSPSLNAREYLPAGRLPKIDTSLTPELALISLSVNAP